MDATRLLSVRALLALLAIRLAAPATSPAPACPAMPGSFLLVTKTGATARVKRVN
jgi:hypothetical protein